MTALDQAQIQQALLGGQAVVFSEISSTNDYLLNHAHELEQGSICLAERQSAGRGRRGRAWYSPKSQNLYFSLLWRYDTDEVADLSALSLVVSLIIAETLQAQGVAAVQIKWPNDIYYQGKKMGGILIEIKAEQGGVALVIGIGLNLAMANDSNQHITQPWADLSAYQFDRNKLASELAYQLQKNLKIYPLVGFSYYLERWQSFDIFAQKAVKLVTETHEIYGISQGINEKGELLLRQGNQINAFRIGEISLRQM